MYAEGSVLVEMGNTKVICTASVEDKVPPFLEGKGLGWVTAEYAMLPRATNTRKKRDIKSLKLDGRSSEIQRLIGRSLRAVVDREALGERQITIDCDVIQADGGTRCASITGGFVALWLACKKLVEDVYKRQEKNRLRREARAAKAAERAAAKAAAEAAGEGEETVSYTHLTSILMSWRARPCASPAV